jgi:hypothetical protein
LCLLCRRRTLFGGPWQAQSISGGPSTGAAYVRCGCYGVLQVGVHASIDWAVLWFGLPQMVFFLRLVRLRSDVAFAGETVGVSGRFSGCSIVLSLFLLCWLGAGCWACLWDLGLTACHASWLAGVAARVGSCTFVLLCLLYIFISYYSVFVYFLLRPLIS